MSLRATVGIPASAAEQSAKHVLYVEGEEPDGFDVQVIKELIDKWLPHAPITVRGIGASENARAMAEGLFRMSPTNYFLIDRDCYDDEYVKKCWESFPDPNTRNLIIWKKRELENYFLDSDFISQSVFFRREQYSIQDLKVRILQTAQSRLYFEVVNLTILEIREGLREKWITLFTDPAPFGTEQNALSLLCGRREFDDFKARSKGAVSKINVQQRFHSILRQCLGKSQSLSFGHGKWQDLLSGKELMRQVFNNYFSVFDTAGQPIVGKEAITAIGRELVRLPLTQLPLDFRKFLKLLERRL